MKKAFLFLIAFNILRLVLIPFIDFLPSEVSFLSLNHDHAAEHSVLSPLIIWLSHLLRLLGSENIFVVRGVFFVLSLVMQWYLYKLIIKIIRPKRKYLTWATICSVSSVTLVSVTAMSDALLLLFWVLAILTLYKAIFEENKLSWLLSGIFIGLAMLNKLSGITLPIGLILFLIFSSRYRNYLFTAGPYVSLISAALISLPIWTGAMRISNPLLQYSQMEAIAKILHLPSINYFGFVGFQVILILPILYIGLWWVTLKYFGRIFKKPNQVNPEFWFLLSFFLPPFVGFHLISIFSRVDFLGLIPIYITGMIVLLKLIKTRWIYWSLGFSILAHLLFVLALWF